MLYFKAHQLILLSNIFSCVARGAARCTRDIWKRKNSPLVQSTIRTLRTYYKAANKRFSTYLGCQVPESEEPLENATAVPENRTDAGRGDTAASPLLQKLDHFTSQATESRKNILPSSEPETKKRKRSSFEEPHLEKKQRTEENGTVTGRGDTTTSRLLQKLDHPTSQNTESREIFLPPFKPETKKRKRNHFEEPRGKKRLRREEGELPTSSPKESTPSGSNCKNDGIVLEIDIQSSSTEKEQHHSEESADSIETGTYLTPEEITILKSQGFDGFLDDELIRKAQELLQAQFPDFDGLQPTAVLLIPGYAVEGKAVQIHFDEDRAHWITTCFKDGSILIADSMRQIWPSSAICTQICNIYGNVLQEPLEHIQYLDVDQQLDEYNCGLFSIANAFELLSDDGDPTRKYDHSKLRQHLISCFKKGQISSFP